MDAAGFLGLPPRVAKPREVGMTHVMDKGLSLAEIRSMLEIGGDIIDIDKLGWGPSYETGNQREKLDLYRTLANP
ncbi:MAG: phosphosulfolactate synthase, partial [Actinomycetota bacterium]